MQKLLALFLFVCSPAYAVQIACGGYNPEINDHVEWGIKIVGADAYGGDQHFKVRETKKLFVLTGSHSRIVINKKTTSYVTYGRSGKAVEWSRKTPGEGCDFSN